MSYEYTGKIKSQHFVETPQCSFLSLSNWLLLPVGHPTSSCLSCEEASAKERTVLAQLLLPLFIMADPVAFTFYQIWLLFSFLKSL